MKKLLIASLLILGATTTFAQSEKTKAPVQAATPAAIEGRATMHTTKLARELNLTVDQKAKVQEVNKMVEQQMDNIRQAGPAASPARTTRMLEYRDEQFKNILTAEQYTKYQASKPASAATVAPVSTK